MHELDHQCANYLKDKKILGLMKGLKEKYKSLGAIGGIIILKDPSDMERSFLQSHVRQHLMDHKTIRIGMVAFVKGFEGTIYQGIDFHGVLECYFEETIVSNKHENQVRKKGIEDYFMHEIENRKSTEVSDWLSEISGEKTSCYKWLVALYHNAQDQLTLLLSELENVIALLETEGLLLIPILAAKATKDPHALDGDQPLLKVLLYFLAYKNDIDMPKSAVEKSELLNRGGVLTNALNRSVLTYGLRAEKAGISLGWENFNERNEPLSLLESNFKDAQVGAKNHVVYCFENPAVFQYFVNKNPWAAAICTNGQINITIYKLLGALIRSEVDLVYNGDFDPEGLLIAEKLRQKFPNIQLMGYTEVLYHKSKSHKVISETRLKQLKNVTSPELEVVKDLLMTHKRAGYQEYIMDELLERLVRDY